MGVSNTVFDDEIRDFWRPYETYYHNSSVQHGNDGRSLYNGYKQNQLQHVDNATDFNWYYGPQDVSSGDYYTLPLPGNRCYDNYVEGFDPSCWLYYYTWDPEESFDKPYLYNEPGYARQVYNSIESDVIDLRFHYDGYPVHDWHAVCMDFDVFADIEYRHDVHPDPEDLGGNDGASDWWRVKVYAWEDGDSPELYYDSYAHRGNWGDAGSMVPYSSGGPFGEGSEITFEMEDGTHYDFAYLEFEFFSNPNPFKGAGVWIDNIRIYSKFDNAEPNETFANAFDLDATYNELNDPNERWWRGMDYLTWTPYWADMGNYEHFETDCAMILPEVGGLYFPDNRDEDFYKLTLGADQYCDIVVDNQEIDLQVQIYGPDPADPDQYRLVVTDDGSASNGMPYNSDYDRVIFTIDTDLPNFVPGDYIIAILPSDNVSLQQTGRYRLSINRGYPDTDLLAVADVPQDQGLQVRLTWDPSFLDTECIPIWCCNNDDGNPLQLNGIRVEKYTVWRIAGFYKRRKCK